MNTSLKLFEGKKGLPAHIAAAFGEEDSNVKVRDSVPSLTFRGSKWRVRNGDEEVVLTKMVDGEKVAVPSVQVVVVAVNPERSRNFYDGPFVEGENRTPDCWSLDGLKPAKDVAEPVASSCKTCPNSAKGSRITDAGKESTLCTAYKRVVVVPISALDSTPLLLKIPQTSLWDKSNAEMDAQGKFAWDQYMKFLHNRGVNHTAALVTRIEFDQSPAYPKLLFSAVRFLEEAELAKVAPLTKAEEIRAVAMGFIDESVVDAEPKAAVEEDDEDEAFEQVAPKKAAAPARKAPAKKAAPVIEDEDEDEEDDDEDAFAAAAEPAKKAPVKKAPVKTEPVKTAPVSKTPAEKKAKSKPPVPTEAEELDDTPAGLDALISEWDSLDAD